jgi:hypothetical protein
VFRELTKIEQEKYNGPVNYITMVEAYKKGPSALSPLRICERTAAPIGSQLE